MEATLPSSYYSTLQAYQKPQVNDILTKIYPNPNEIKVIVDGTCHIGGDSINFASHFPNAIIYTIDIDKSAIDCMNKNISNDKDRYVVVNDDFINWVKSGEYADFYYLDPPWGGPTYVEEENISLYLSGVSLEDITVDIIKRGLSNKVILKVSKNFNYTYFKSNVEYNTKIYPIKKHKKKKAIAYYLIVVSRHTQEIEVQ